MSYLITFAVGALLGFVAGALVYRKNQSRVEAGVAKANAVVDAIKK